MRKEYIEELEKLKERMIAAEKFAKKLPFFSEQILNNKLTGDEHYTRFGNKYKDIYFHWDICRGLFTKGESREITNYRGKHYSEFLFTIYVNTYSLFNHHAIRVDEVSEQVDLFFYDKLNSTFYATDEQIVPLLEALNSWYLKSVEENKKLLAEGKKKEAEKKLKEAQKELEGLIELSGGEYGKR